MLFEFTNKRITTAVIVEFTLTNTRQGDRQRQTQRQRVPDSILVMKGVEKTINLEINPARVYSSIASICKTLSGLSETQLCLCITNLPHNLKYILLNRVAKALYTFRKYKTTNKNSSATTKVFVHDFDKNKKKIADILHVLACSNLTRNLENEPANMMSPEKFSSVIRYLLQKQKRHIQHKVKIRVMNETEMRKQGLNLVLAIGLSSKRMPRFMTIECVRDASAPTICIIGKTVIYDAGGLNLKEGKAMSTEMKTDKSGGCVVVGVIKYFMENDIKCNIVGILPIVENLVSEDVTRPGDIIKSYNGKTVEITDTDAEGRLIMADALAYSKQFNPTYIFDVATLTGWSETVHSDLAAVCFSTNKELSALVAKVGDTVGERVWFLPPWDEYIGMTKSKVANVRNYNSDVREGAYMPSLFLMNFVPIDTKDKYVHFDICHNYQNDIAQGHCVALMIELIKTLSQGKRVS